MNGFELAREIRKRDCEVKKVAFLTAFDVLPKDLEQSLIEFGPLVLLMKPMPGEEQLRAKR